MSATVFFLIGSLGIAHAETMRGIELIQPGNQLISPSLGRSTAYSIDLSDEFESYAGREIAGSTVARAAGNELVNTYVDGHRIGFVPPVGGVPDGPLTGAADTSNGLWMGSTDYTLSSDFGGSVGRSDASQVGFVCLPWFVTPELGDFYLLEVAAVVSPGESVRVAYMDEVDSHLPGDGLLGDVGQIALSVARDSGTSDEINWELMWGTGAARQSMTGQLTSPEGSELDLQLGWNESSGEFDAWLNDTRLHDDLLDDSINVHGAGFELTGTLSRATSMLTAVPEPGSATLIAIGLLSLLSVRRRNH